ncbi:MAG: hypothetical protein DYG98_06295 [Haliscomenobacteraceae bacterium CHB4]|nr:hypothetical protein [Haliscomenobacteraceae bacterium CHB4]
MTEITLKIKRPEDLELVMQLVKRLRIPYSKNVEQKKRSASDLQETINFILAYQNDTPSFGDALEWQRQEREDRDLRS